MEQLLLRVQPMIPQTDVRFSIAIDETKKDWTSVKFFLSLRELPERVVCA